MSTKDQAKKIVTQFLDGNTTAATHLTTQLTDAGLLAPDLPEPDECPQDIHTPGWHLEENFYAAPLGGIIWVTNERGWGRPKTVEETRVYAYKLLAAAEWAEKHPPRFRKEGQQ